MAESGKIILGRVQPRHLGQWDAAGGYTVLDQVSYAGELWQCVAATTPGTAPTAANSAWWAKLSADATSVEALEQALAGKADASELAEVKAGLDDKLDKNGGTANFLFFKNGQVEQISIQDDIELGTAPDAQRQKDINFLDIAGNRMGSFDHAITPDGTSRTSMFAIQKVNGESKTSGLMLFLPLNGIPYTSSPAPRESAYANDIDTLRASINRHHMKLTGSLDLHVGGANASDTADLFMGRGYSEDMPFATLRAAVNWVYQNLSGPYEVRIILHADAELDDQNLRTGNISALILEGNSQVRNIKTTGIGVRDGNLRIHGNLSFTAKENAKGIFVCDAELGSSHMTIFNDTVVNGAVSLATVFAKDGAQIRVRGTITGDITGKRYSCEYGGRIITWGKGPDFIPGTIAGTSDEYSVYF